MHFTTVSSTLLFAAAALAAPSSKRSEFGTPAGTIDESIDIDAVLPPVVPVNTRAGDPELIKRLMTAPTQVERFKLLDQPGDFVFDFLTDGTAPEGAESKGKGGFSIAATSETFPALIGNGAGMTVAFLGPCGMNVAHVHPRATELNIIVKGRLVTNFVMENTLDPIANTMDTFQMAVFPQGAIHQEFNPDCDDAIFVAGFDSADPGVNTVATNFFRLNGDVVSATLGGMETLNGADIESFRELIPANIALGIDTCLKKCGISRNAKRDLNDLIN